MPLSLVFSGQLSLSSLLLSMVDDVDERVQHPYTSSSFISPTPWSNIAMSFFTS